MASIKLTNKQLMLIQKSLDLYSRIGILQIDEILSHPSIDNCITDQFTPKKILNVGDNTTRGEIVEIGDDYIKTKGSWGNGIEIKTWIDISNIKLSPDWGEIQHTRSEIKKKISEIKYLITGDADFYNADFGLYGDKTNESCREAFDILQFIRHEFWKINENRSNATVDSHIYKSTMDDSVQVTLDDIKDIRKRKITKINK